EPTPRDGEGREDGEERSGDEQRERDLLPGLLALTPQRAVRAGVVRGRCDLCGVRRGFGQRGGRWGHCARSLGLRRSVRPGSSAGPVSGGGAPCFTLPPLTSPI